MAERWKVEGVDERGAAVFQVFPNETEARVFAHLLAAFGPVTIIKQQLVPVGGTPYVDWQDVREPKVVELSDGV